MISINDWNDTLRKSQKIHSSRIGQAIRSRANPSKLSVAILLKQIVAIKLYTDFDALQHELKKCLRGLSHHTSADEVFTMRERLASYSNWAQTLTLCLEQFSVSLRCQRLFHGVNPMMSVQRHDILSRLWGTLNTTTLFHMASTFATDKGMIMEISSQYPSLDLCYAFDVSPLSDYPEEAERIIGRMYVRVRRVHSKQSYVV